MDGRRKKMLRDTLLCIGILAAYYLFIRLTGLHIPCIFRRLTGLKCPGCGISSMFMELSHFHIKKAFAANRLVFIAAPLLIFIRFMRIFRSPKWLEPSSRPYNAVMLSLLAATVAFGITRNIFGF